MRIVLAGGGTAGHIFPTLAVAARLNDLLGAAGSDLMIVSGSRELDRRLYRDAPYEVLRIKVRGIVGTSPLRLPWRLWRLLSSTAAMWREFSRRRPDVIVASGGYVSVPAMLAGRLHRVPIVLFSGDAQPGWATRVMSPLASVTTVAFREAARRLFARHTEFAGYPLRAAFRAANRAAGRARAGVTPDDRLLLVMGGSQGAHAINTAVKQDLPRLLERAVVVHVTGQRDLPEYETAASELDAEGRARYRVHGFIDEGFADLLAAADLVVSRAGATSAAELSAVGAPAILIPGAFGAGHQIRTAEAMEAVGAAVSVREHELAAGRLADAALELFDDEPALACMREASRARGRPDGAGDVARIAIRLVRPAWAGATS